MRTPRGNVLVCLLLLAVPAVTATAARAAWAEFVDETATRLVAGVGNGADDVEEKAFAWGDLDRDGDIDLVVGRKAPFASLDKATNVLLVNEGGILVDRTAEFASASTVAGDFGFRTPTNDRGIKVVDVDLDGWLDVVTATTDSEGDPKHIGHPRIYINLGCEAPCSGTEDWLGLRFENDRIPAMLTDDGIPGHNPCFLDLAVGDVRGPIGEEPDGYPEIWFADGDLHPHCEDLTYDFNSKLLLNQGSANPGYFTDVTEESFSEPFAEGFAASADVADLNGDGSNDLIKQTAEEVSVALKNPATSGWFDTFDTPYDIVGSYFVSTGDLNNDGLVDLLVTDGGADRYLLNQGNSPSGIAQFVSHVYSFSHDGPGGASADDGFGGRNIAADLNHDGWDDVLVADVDNDGLGVCTRRMHIYRNLGGVSGDAVGLEEQTTGQDCEWFLGNPASCLVAGIPSDMLEGVYDVAVFDIDGDDWNDLVVGRCTGTELYINVPPGPPAGALDTGGGPSSQLQLSKQGASGLMLSWAPSCVAGDTDYSVYEGQLSAIGQHEPIACSTGGATEYVATPAVPDAYYLVVPHNGVLEGSYGVNSQGDPRPVGQPACRVQYVATCPAP